LANAGAAALVTVVTPVTNDGAAQLEPLIASYQQADSAAEKATAEASFYQTELNDLVGKIGNDAATPPQQAQEQTLNAKIAQWETQADLSRLQADAYMNQYNSALPPLQEQQEMVQQVGTAVYNGSNQKAFTEAGGLVGVVGGLVVGLAGAALIDTRRGRRSGTARG
jgi:uncharacterized protein YpuA (DUF1002 family)